MSKLEAGEHTSKPVVEKQLDLEAEEAYYGILYDEYSLSDIGCGSISIEED